MCVDYEYNKVLSSGLIAEERTQLLLEIPSGERDYKVALLEENLWETHLWSSVEVEQGIPVLPLNLILPLLCLQHAIHLVFGSTELQPLTTRELSLVEEIMSGKFHIP